MNRNILICRGTIKSISPDYIKRIKSAIAIDNSYVVVGYINQIELFEDESYCLLREDCIVGKYSKYIGELNLELEPLDSWVLGNISSSISKIMMMQRRFEDRMPLRISSKLEDHYQLTITQIQFWNSFLVNKNIDTVIFSDVPHEAYDNVLYDLCKIKGIKTILYRSLFKTKKYFVIEDYRELATIVSSKLNKCDEKHIDSDVSDIQLSQSVDELYNALIVENRRSSLFREETLRSNEFRYRFGEVKPHLYVRSLYRKIKTSGGKSNAKHNFLSYIRDYAFILKKYKDTKQFIQQYNKLSELPLAHEKYIYYALHLLPECAVTPLGGLFSDQYLAICMLSSCIPTDWKLYIKVHPAQVDMIMSINEIKKYKQLKNVRIISENTNQYELIRNSVAVSTLSGEIALEALFFRKPSILFGYTYYSASPLAFTISTKEELCIVLKRIQEERKECEYKDIRKYFKALDEATYEGLDNVILEIVKRLFESEG